MGVIHFPYRQEANRSHWNTIRNNKHTLRVEYFGSRTRRRLSRNKIKHSLLHPLTGPKPLFARPSRILGSTGVVLTLHLIFKYMSIAISTNSVSKDELTRCIMFIVDSAGFIYIYIYICVCVCVCVCVYWHVCVCTCFQVHNHTHKHIHTHIDRQIDRYAYGCVGNVTV